MATMDKNITYIIFKNNFIYFICESYLIFSLFFLICCGMIISSFKYNYKLNANFYELYCTFLILTSVYVLLNYTLNIINYSYSLFSLSYSVDPLIYLAKVLLFILLFFFSIILKNYSRIIKVYNFEIFFLLSSSVLGIIFLLSSSDFINMYLSIELYSLSMYCFMAHFKNKLIAIEAAFKYFIIGSITSALILLSISGIYAILGTFNYFEIELLLYFNNISPLNIFIFDCLINFFICLLILSFLIKIGAAPFHFWYIDIYSGSPYIVTFFLLVISKFSFLVVILYLLNFVFYSLLNLWKILIIVVLIVSILVGYIGAIYQIKIKKIIAYSSVSNLSLFLSLYFICNFYSLSVFIIVSFIYFMNLIAFFYCILLSFNITSKSFISKISHLKSLFNSNKFLTVLFVVVIFSLASLPPFIGFFSKLFVLLLLSEGTKINYLIIFLILFGGVFSIFYYLRMIKIMTNTNYLNFIFFYNINYFLSFILALITFFLFLSIILIDDLMLIINYILFSEF
jgi:NADH-quinone oxidoreductase subunit N